MNKGHKRYSQILQAVLDLAAQHGYKSVTRQMIADECDIRSSHIGYYFGTMDNVRDTIVRTAVASGRYDIAAQALPMEHPEVINAPEDVKREIIKYLEEVAESA